MAFKHGLKAEEIDRLADAYLQRCQEEKALPTMPGLALALGLDNRQELGALAAGKGACAAALRRAMCRVEDGTVQASYKRDSGPGARFILQNDFGYSEKAAPAPAQEHITVRLVGEE